MCIALCSVTVSYASIFQRIVNYMVAAVVCTEVILHGCICMRYSNVIEGRIARKTSCFEQEFQVHHVIDDNWAFPSAFTLPSSVCIPRLDNSGYRTEAGRKRLCSGHDDILVFRFLAQTVSGQVAASNHEAYIVMPFQVFHRVQVFCIFFSQFLPFFIFSQVIIQPHCSREETTGPVIDRYIYDISLFVDGTRVQDFTTFFNQVSLQSVLSFDVFDFIFQEVVCLRWFLLASSKSDGQHADES